MASKWRVLCFLLLTWNMSTCSITVTERKTLGCYSYFYFSLSADKSIIWFFHHRCSTHITGMNVVFNECKGGSCITRPCRRDSKTGLYEAKCTFIPDKSQTARDSIMFMQSLDSVSAFQFYAHKEILRGKNKEADLSAVKFYVPTEKGNYSGNSLEVIFSGLCQDIPGNYHTIFLLACFFTSDVGFYSPF